MSISKITPFLWFPNPKALEAAEFYTSLFNASPSARSSSKPPSTILVRSHYTEAMTHFSNPAPGDILTVHFTLAGQHFAALNGPFLPDNPGNTLFQFNESVSFSIDCEDQGEVDYFWEELTKDGGSEVECGWVKDKFGVSWQVVPKEYMEFIESEDEKLKERVQAAVMKMKKLIVKDLLDAAKGV